LATYIENGWMFDMQNQISIVNGLPINLNQSATNIINAKFRITDLTLYENFPVPVVDQNRIPGLRYKLFQFYSEFTPEPELSTDLRPLFNPNTPNHNNERTFRRFYAGGEREYLAAHSLLQSRFHQYLNSLHPDRTEKEADAGYGNCRIDLKFKDYDDRFIFFEIKTYPSILTSLRAGIGQLMEYACYPEREDAKQLIVVSFAPPDRSIIQYLEHLSQLFKIPFGYIQFDHDNMQILSRVNCQSV
jgi:hypothetical protein